MKHLFLAAFICLAHLLPAQITSYPANIYADTAHAPFVYGVASGDPTDSQVIIWTRIDPAAGSSVQVDWELAADSSFSNVLQSGTATVDGSTDHSLAIDVGNLAPGLHYWYRFKDPQGNSSVIGRTKTAPTGSVSNVRLAIASCSSIYSGFFNAYSRIGERNDIDAVIHLGDYVYDFVDQDEEERVPVPYPTRPEDLEDWRDLHEYHLLDPDLRLARQRHPWIVIWDNHDIASDSFPQFLQAVQAFHEYVPMRLPDANAPTRIYRSFSFGDLFDLMALDYEQYYHQDMIGSEQSALGTDQRTWLLNQLSASTATWRVVANQKMFGQFSLAGFPSIIPFGDGPVADSSAWDGHNAEREAILGHLDQNGIDNTILLSGDIHMSFTMDLPIDYGNYNSANGAGSVAVEFLPTSITRGNFDEEGFGGFLATLAQGAIELANPHHIFSELESHGYGLLDIRADRAVGEYWYVEKGNVTGGQNFEGGYQVDAGANHWNRNKLNSPTVYSPPTSSTPISYAWGQLSAFPNPANEVLHVSVSLQKAAQLQLDLREALSGRVVREIYKGNASAGHELMFDSDTKDLPAGIYLLGCTVDGVHHSKTLILQH